MRCRDRGLRVALGRSSPSQRQPWSNPKRLTPGRGRKRWSLAAQLHGQRETSLLSARLPGLDSKVWFTVAKGIISEVFYPRLDVPNMQDMQYVITDGSTFVDLERDATSHAVSMPTEKALEYTVTNTDTDHRPSIGSPTHI